MANHEGHCWRQQPTSHFAALRGRDGKPACAAGLMKKVLKVFLHRYTGESMDEIELTDAEC